MTKFINLEEAERNARLRDIESSKILSEEEIQLANELQAKASSRGMKLVPERKIKNKAKFVQIIQQNLQYLFEIDYLTNAEKVFLLNVSMCVGFLSNCLVNDINSKEQIPLTQRELAKKIGRHETKVSPLVRKLIDKGIIARSESGVDNNNVRAYALFINPHIMFSGNRDEVNPTLKAMFKKVPKQLKNLPIKLF
ncbi:MarR family transcriptional regulator [Bacillus cereus]|uniref:MarR family transcriptional regulator n=1 Tax=Bacillus cereus group TaxID=86661 RepID=UPI002404A132|nr:MULTISPECIES: MarR family transcriptional regulator [Bacillus cereus group]MDF9506947.1 MarR family transcriptional regulator [Bacillus cereus]MDF9598093.1 MarR family transcriptional regulator [Bacillus cereus]MDF9610315.1 MarR family transcriptional regulator [Bacillus cereus]MDF9661225.1 MarR family transcriptional regulator [Bacillus cereus]MEB4819313.1 MarR family transcriptional regulator [Bacillus thuringiensis]